jgi:membrane fusion protein (multidrug efflux system)
VDGFGDRAFEGRVERINPVTEQGSRSITLYLSVANTDGALKGGMFAKGSLVLERSASAPVIPTSAVREDAGQTYVYTLEKGKIERRPVQLGLRDEQSGFVELRSGITPGTQVISARMTGLKPGAAAVVKTPVAVAAPKS